MNFCNDTDLLHWEPHIFKDAALASQTLITGTGDLAGTTFTLDSAGSLTASHVAESNVIVLTGTNLGSYPIVSVDSAAQLTLSVLYDGLYPLGDPAVPSPVGTANDIAFAIRTFSPQAKIVSDFLRRAAGVGSETPHPNGAITSPETLRRACTMGTLQMIYNALSAAAPDDPALTVRADLYERLFRRAIQRAHVELDLDGDGEPDTSRTLGVLQMDRR